MYLWARWEQAARDSAGKQDLGAWGRYYHPPTVHKVVKNYALTVRITHWLNTGHRCHAHHLHACMLL